MDPAADDTLRALFEDEAETELSAIEALLPVTLAVAPVVPLLVAAAFLAGLAIEQFTIAWDTSLQEHVAPDRLARVASYDAIGSFVAIPVAEVAAGPTAEAIGTDTTLLAAAALILAATAAMVASRSIRTLEHRQPAA